MDGYYRKLWQHRLYSLPNPNCDVFCGWILEPFNLIKTLVVETHERRRKGILDIEKINDKACNRINYAFEFQFDTVGMAVHLMTSMCRRNIWQAVCRLKGEGLSYLHLIPITL